MSPALASRPAPSGIRISFRHSFSPWSKQVDATPKYCAQQRPSLDPSTSGTNGVTWLAIDRRLGPATLPNRPLRSAGRRNVNLTQYMPVNKYSLFPLGRRSYDHRARKFSTSAYVGSVWAYGLSVTVVATLTNVAVFVCILIGASWTIKLQYFILAILGLALASFYVGAFTAFDHTILHGNLAPHFGKGESFFTVFALFFPAVTGIMAGANMSGDLRDPARAIPRGTLAAVVVTAAIYLSLVILLAAARPHLPLTTDNLVLADIARWPALITAGVFAATLSSARRRPGGVPGSDRRAPSGRWDRSAGPVSRTGCTAAQHGLAWLAK